MPHSYRTRDVAELLGIAPARVRRLVRMGLLEPPRDARGYRFSFQDLVLLRAAVELAASDLGPRRIDRALRALRRQLPGRPLSAVRVGSEGGRVVARDGETAWEPASGQLVLSFESPSVPTARALTSERPPGRSAPPAEEAPGRGVDQEISPAEWFEIGCGLEIERPEEARLAYSRALELEPDHAGAHLNLGRLLHEHGRLAAAEAHYRAALAADPGSATAAFNLGVALEDQGRAERAIEAYLRAVASDPTFADAHFNLSRLYEATGDRPAALRHLRSYSRLSKTS